MDSQGTIILVTKGMKEKVTVEDMNYNKKDR